MRSYPTFTLSRLLLAIAGLALLLGAVRVSVMVLEAEFWRVHPSEQRIADYIRDLGGAYHADAKNDWHITGVWLQNTEATDRDVEVVMQLQYLKDLDVAKSRVTDASLDKIFEHKHIKTLKVAGSAISKIALRAALIKSEDRIVLDE